jgi:hypothetical protein
MSYLTIRNEIRFMIREVGLLIHNFYPDLINMLKKYNHKLFLCYLGRETFFYY